MIYLWELLGNLSIPTLFLKGEAFALDNYLFNETETLSIKKYDPLYIYQSRCVIATFGSTVNECIYLGNHVLSIAHSKENAKGSAILASRTPACQNLGYFKSLDARDLLREIEYAMRPNKVREMWLDSEPIDGQAVSRIVKWIDQKNGNTHN
jgi:hypothetical protein